MENKYLLGCNYWGADYGTDMWRHYDPVRIRKEMAQLSEYGVRCIDAILDLAKRYKEEAEKEGRDDLVDVLSRVPARGATTFHEALQMMRIIHYSLWLEGNYHNTLGRFDQYVYPYLKADLESGRLTRHEAFELLCDFFLSFNKDSDIYVGVQQGDNGQSMVLGGIDKDGNWIRTKTEVFLSNVPQDIKDLLKASNIALTYQLIRHYQHTITTKDCGIVVPYLMHTRLTTTNLSPIHHIIVKQSIVMIGFYTQSHRHCTFNIFLIHIISQQRKHRANTLTTNAQHITYRLVKTQGLTLQMESVQPLVYHSQNFF